MYSILTFLPGHRHILAPSQKRLVPTCTRRARMMSCYAVRVRRIVFCRVAGRLVGELVLEVCKLSLDHRRRGRLVEDRGGAKVGDLYKAIRI